MANGELTRKQKVFVEAYLTTWNATEAARQAGYKHPNKEGPRMLVNVGIQARIEERMREKALGADEVLARLSEQGRVSIGDFIKEITKEEEVIPGIRTLVTVFALDWDEIKRRGHLVKSVSMTANGPKIELYDGQAALVQMGKHLRLFADNVDLTSGGKPLKTIEVTAIDYRTAIAALAPGSVGDSTAPGEDEDPFNGKALG